MIYSPLISEIQTPSRNIVATVSVSPIPNIKLYFLTHYFNERNLRIVNNPLEISG